MLALPQQSAITFRRSKPACEARHHPTSRRTHHRPTTCTTPRFTDQPVPSLPRHALLRRPPEWCRGGGVIRRARRTQHPTRERTTLHHTETELHMKATRTRRTRSLLAVPALAAAATLVLAGCGSRAGDSAESADSAAASESCIDTSGDTIKLGFLNSLTGGMAISEQTVSNVLHMAADEINADGGILGKQIEYVQEDGATDWP